MISSSARATMSNISMKRFLFWGIFVFFGPLAILSRFYFLNNALLEPHPWRQTQTALTILHLFQGTATVWDYRSPLQGILWNNVYEFPLYQWVVCQVMHLGLSLEVASRLVTLVSFFVSAVFSYLIILQFFNRQIANWFLLIYSVNPFGVIFSRVCLIDFFALAATLGSIYGLLQLRAGSMKARNWLCFALGGLIAGLAKINIWFFITVSFTGLMMLEVWQQKNRNWGWFVGLVGILLVQLGVIFLWNYHRFNDLGSPADTPWLVGELSQRFETWRWKKILWDFLTRSLLYDWLFIPFILGSWVLFRKSKLLFVVLYGVFISHTLVFFQVQTYHDYYLIASMPYLFFIAALGLDYLVTRQTKIIQALCFIVLGLMIFKSFQLRYYYGPIAHDYRGKLASIYQLKKFTEPADIVYWDAKQGRFEIATYSQRNVGLSETERLIGEKNRMGQVYSPTVFHFDSKPNFQLMSKTPRVWLDGEPHFVIHRVAEVRSFKFEPEENFAVFSELPEGVSPIRFREKVDNCKSQQPLLMSLPLRSGLVVISIEGYSHPFRLPGGRKFLNLPNHSKWGCRFEIKFEAS